MNLQDIAARANHLDQLSRGLSKVVIQVVQTHDALLYCERQDYLKAIREALAGVEATHVTLAKARQRLEEET